MKGIEAFEGKELHDEKREKRNPHAPQGPRSAESLDEKIIKGLMSSRGLTREQALEQINKQMKDRIKKDTAE